MKKILVPTDFSDQAQYALQLANVLAPKMDAEVVVLHVVEDGSGSSVHYTGEVGAYDMTDRMFVMKMIENARTNMAKVHEDFPELVLREEIRIGNAYHSIKDQIAEHKVDLVIMGTRGAGGIDEILIGSNAERVVRYAKCPVLTVHAKVEKASFDHLVLATGTKNLDIDFIKVLKLIQKLFNSIIHLVRVNTPNNFETDRESRASLKRFVEDAEIENYELHIYNDMTEEDGIINFADRINADMIAMTTHGRTGLAHLLTGSIAEDVVNHTRRPVLTHVMD
ncbi:MAG: universal stress protein [Bacteroidota bacterium]